MADKSYDILISIDAKISAIDTAVQQIQNLHSVAESAGQAFQFAGAIDIVHRIADGIAEIPAKLYEAISAGVEFQAKLQDVATGIAAVLTQTQPGRFADFTEAKKAAVDYIEVIKASANKVGIAYEDMFEAVTHTQTQLASAGITDISQVIQATQLLVQAMQSVGVSASQASRDIGDILQGNAARTLGGGRLAAAINETKESFDKLLQSHIQEGDLLTFLQTKFSGFAAAIQDSSNNFNADSNRLKNAILDIEGEAAKPIMEPLKSGIDGAIDPAKIEQFKILAHTIGELGAEALGAVGKIVSLGTAIEEVGKKYHVLAGVLLAISNSTPGGLLFHGVNDAVADAFDKSKAAVEQQNVATKQAIQNGQQLGATYQQTVEPGAQKLNEAAQKQADLIYKANQEARILQATLSGDGPTVAAEKGRAAFEKFIEEAAKLGPITNAEIDAGHKIEESVSNQTLALFAKKSAAAGNRAEAEAEKETHQQITDLQREESQLLTQLKAQEKSVNDNPFISADAKQSQLHQIDLQQQAEVTAEIKRTSDALNGAFGPPSQAEVTQLQGRLSSLGTTFQELQFSIAKSGFTGALRADLTSFANQFGSTSHQIATAITSTIGSAVSGLSNAITGLIFKTQTWQQAFAQAAQAIIGNLINIVLQWIAQQAVILALNAIFGKAAGSIANKQAESAAAAWAPAATAASIASYGAAAGFGTAAFIAALAVGTGAAVAASSAGGFQSGGFTGLGSSSEVAGLVHRNEFVVSAPAVGNLGLAFLENIHTVGRQGGGFALGGYTGGGSSASSGSSGKLGGETHIFILMDEREMQRRVLESTAAVKKIVRVVNEAGGNLRG
ncbi:MAG: hypothetical protein H0X40_02965 [Chthoniobacterales bacterium]|nr:hypothetical protein [Chthoniobacterales bacterium]